MAELTASCCSTEAQASCCEPEAKGSCCGTDAHAEGSCGCSAVHEHAASPIVRARKADLPGD